MKIHNLTVIPYTDNELDNYEVDEGRTFFDTIALNESADSLFSAETNALIAEQVSAAHIQGRRDIGTHHDRKLNRSLWERIIIPLTGDQNVLVGID